MNSGERRATLGLASIFGLRMLGLFLILPVFALYGTELSGATPMLIGLAIGAYGLTQAVLQIPFGMLSDRIGRRPVIVMGLLIFALGSGVAAEAQSIVGVIMGRALQGCGAIAAAVMALAADLTRDSQRTKSMALIGISVGAAFLLALVAGPMIAAAAGLSGVFWATAVLALFAVALLYGVVPAGGEPAFRAEVNARPGVAGGIAASRSIAPRLWGADIAFHFDRELCGAAGDTGVTACGGACRSLDGLCPGAVAIGAGMAGLISLGERRQILHRLLAGVAGLVIVADLLLAGFSDSLPVFILGLWLFFVGFNTLEASLPSLLTRFAPEGLRGTALGVYATAQFFGAFLGGTLGGLVYGGFGVAGVFLTCALAAAVWLVSALGLKAPVATVQPASQSTEAS
jgi:Arabinose efflux permease